MPKWARGQSGNPAGRPKGSGLLTEALRRELDKPHLDALGRPDGKTNAETIAERIVDRAARGFPDAYRMIFDRLEGKPKVMEQDDNDLEQAGYGIVIVLREGEQIPEQFAGLKLYEAGNSPADLIARITEARGFDHATQCDI